MGHVCARVASSVAGVDADGWLCQALAAKDFSGPEMGVKTIVKRHCDMLGTYMVQERRPVR